MSEIIKTYRQKLPAVRFIGKKYGDADRVNGSFSKYWGDFFSNGWFDAIENAAGGAGKCGELYEDGGAYLGLMRCHEGEPFQYWIGMFTPVGTKVPDGFGYVDLPASELGVCWVYGSDKTGDIYCVESECAEKLKQEGFPVSFGADGEDWFFERYGCPRFTHEDEHGNVILDICFVRGGR